MIRTEWIVKHVESGVTTTVEDEDMARYYFDRGSRGALTLTKRTITEEIVSR